MVGNLQAACAHVGIHAPFKRTEFLDRRQQEMNRMMEAKDSMLLYHLKKLLQTFEEGRRAEGPKCNETVKHHPERRWNQSQDPVAPEPVYSEGASRPSESENSGNDTSNEFACATQGVLMVLGHRNADTIKLIDHTDAAKTVLIYACKAT